MTILKSIVTVLILIDFTSNCFAYDWMKCRNEMNRRLKAGGLYGGFGTTTIFPTQYLSSWGGCSSTGKPEEDRKIFFNENYDMIKINFSENNGEYMHAFVSYFQCSKSGEAEFIRLVRNNYLLIFGKIYDRTTADFTYPNNRSETIKNWEQSWDVTPKESFERLESVILSNSSLSKECGDMRF